VPWRDIAAINNIAGPLYVIHAGQVLTIRRVPDEPTIYIVQPGESLSVIGKRFGIGWQIIAADNGIVGPKYVIHAGDELVIRK
jgi:LysM repeat protein